MLSGRLVTIKKYSNRRLYDTEASSYLTQDELAEKIRTGADVTVIDAKTGEDLTKATLTQIIIEGRGAGKLLPAPLLHQLIRLGDDALAEFMERYVGMALELYLQAKRGAESLGGYNPFAAMPFAVPEAFARMFMRGASQAPATQAAPPPEPPPRPADDQMAELRREIEALKEVVGAAVAANADKKTG